MNLAILSVYILQNNPAKFATLPSVFSASAQKKGNSQIHSMEKDMINLNAFNSSMLLKYP